MWDQYGDLVATTVALCKDVRSVVRPHLGSRTAGEPAGSGASGDVTFTIDRVAEEAVEEHLRSLGDVAYYSEDRGLVLLGRPEFLLVIDPIDGTRPAAAGLESCCVSVAAAPFDVSRETGSYILGDVILGVVCEIKNDAVYIGLRGYGARVEGRDAKPVRLSGKTELGNMFWTIGFRGRPAEPMITVLGDLVDLTSVDGGCFDLGSATFCIARVLTGEMDAYLDVGQRMADESGAVREEFLRIGHGAILNNYSYDLAAAALIAGECGAVVTDAYGETLDEYPLIPSGGLGQISALVAGNAELHRMLLERVETGMSGLVERYGSAGDKCPGS